jgi:hypothetical protein
MTDEDESSGNETEQRQYPLIRVPRLRRESETHNAQDRGSGQRRQRHVATSKDDGEPNQKRDQGWSRQQHADRARRRGHALAAAKMQINRVEMSQKRRHRRCHRQTIRRQFQRVRCGPPFRCQRRYSALGEIEQKNEDAERPPQHPTDIGSADVAAALFQNVHAAPTRDQIAERNGAGEIRERYS